MGETGVAIEVGWVNYLCVGVGLVVVVSIVLVLLITFVCCPKMLKVLNEIGFQTLIPYFSELF